MGVSEDQMVREANKALSKQRGARWADFTPGKSALGVKPGPPAAAFPRINL